MQHSCTIKHMSYFPLLCVHDENLRYGADFKFLQYRLSLFDLYESLTEQVSVFVKP